jgi:hypothetical protein
MTIRTTLFLVTIFFCLASCSGQNKKNIILNETFDSNKLGWTEEFTLAHTTEIKDGYLFISSLDTTKYQTSIAPQNVSFLWDLPKKFEITTSIQTIGTSKLTHFGLLLNSPTIDYRFSLNDSGMALLTEYESKRNTEIVITSKDYGPTISLTNKVDFKIKVIDRNCEFYLNENLVGQGTLNAKSWNDIRFFTRSGTAIKIDNLTIKRLD